jgi:hypothetical protein
MKKTTKMIDLSLSTPELMLSKQQLNLPKENLIKILALDITSRVILTLRLLTRRMLKAIAKVWVSTVFTAMVFHMEKNSVKAELSIYGLQIQI